MTVYWRVSLRQLAFTVLPATHFIWIFRHKNYYSFVRTFVRWVITVRWVGVLQWSWHRSFDCIALLRNYFRDWSASSPWSWPKSSVCVCVCCSLYKSNVTRSLRSFRDSEENVFGRNIRICRVFIYHFTFWQMLCTTTHDDNEDTWRFVCFENSEKWTQTIILYVMDSPIHSSLGCLSVCVCFSIVNSIFFFLSVVFVVAVCSSIFVPVPTLILIRGQIFIQLIATNALEYECRLCCLSLSLFLLRVDQMTKLTISENEMEWKWFR